NMVTTAHADAAANYGLAEMPPKLDRYRRAAEFLSVVDKLWDSWDLDAFCMDVDSGHYFRPGSMHATAHSGEFFRVSGPLNVPPSPQGKPVVVQAGASPEGRDLAARYADVVFAAATSLSEAREFREDLRRRTVEHGRKADSILVMPGVSVTVARTREEAEEKR